jgi:hypothetical protein
MICKYLSGLKMSSFTIETFLEGLILEELIDINIAYNYNLSFKDRLNLAVNIFIPRTVTVLFVLSIRKVFVCGFKF